MTVATKAVLNGYISLTDSEKSDFLKALSEELQGKKMDRLEKGFLNEEVRRILGPTSQNNCPCCGK